VQVGVANAKRISSPNRQTHSLHHHNTKTKRRDPFDSRESHFIEAAVPNNALLTALAKAYTWQEQLESGQFEDLEDIAKEQGVDRSNVGRMLQLTALAPDIVESILAGQAFADISLRDFRKGLPVSWDEQQRTLHAAQSN
jgi:hypothetical protein